MTVHVPAAVEAAPFPLELPRQSWLHHRGAVVRAFGDYIEDQVAAFRYGSDDFLAALRCDLEDELQDLLAEVELLGHTRPYHLAGSRLRTRCLIQMAKNKGFSGELQLLIAGAVRKLNDDHRLLDVVEECAWCHRKMTPDQWASIPFRYQGHDPEAADPLHSYF